MTQNKARQQKYTFGREHRKPHFNFKTLKETIFWTMTTEKKKQSLKLQRTLGRGAAIILCFNGIVGSGIFVSPQGKSLQVSKFIVYIRNCPCLSNGRHVSNSVGFGWSTMFTRSSLLCRTWAHNPQNWWGVCHIQLRLWSKARLSFCLGKFHIFFLILIS